MKHWLLRCSLASPPGKTTVRCQCTQDAFRDELKICSLRLIFLFISANLPHVVPSCLIYCVCRVRAVCWCDVCVNLQTEWTDVGMLWHLFLESLCSAAHAPLSVSHHLTAGSEESGDTDRLQTRHSAAFTRFLKAFMCQVELSRRRNLRCTATEDASTSCFLFIDSFEYVFYGTVLSHLE